MRSVLAVLAAAPILSLVSAQAPEPPAGCPDYSVYSTQYHAPFSSGVYNLSSMRPAPNCRTFVSPGVDALISEYSSTIADPDLYRLFQNAFPNTLDTAVKWHGCAANSTSSHELATCEELTFLITGDINAMWLRDSANQMQSYLSLLNYSTSFNSIASLYRGVINLQARYILYDPYCNSFQPPVESGVNASVNGASASDTVKPTYSNETVFECKYELDSLAAFLEISTDYYNRTGDIDFFRRYNWSAAVQNILMVANDMMIPTYQPNGSVNQSPYIFTRLTTRGSETTTNNGLDNPVQRGTGLIRSYFRPSDDSTVFQFLIPSNMMFSHYLGTTANIMEQISGCEGMAAQMRNLSASLSAAITQWGIVTTRVDGEIYAYEVDGYGSQYLMDDANIPSLLAAPLYGYTTINDPIYQRTRAKLLSANDPYWEFGPAFSAIGGPHDGPGYAWPMAAIVRILTSNNDTEITNQLKMLVSTTDGLGLVHESINTFNVTDWTRQWFSWVNGLFGEMIIDLADRKPYILKESFQ